MGVTGGGPGTNQYGVRGVGKSTSKRATAPQPEPQPQPQPPVGASTDQFPPIEFETQQWDWEGHRPRGRADRLFTDYESSIPPQIADIDVRLSRDTLAAVNAATAAIIDLERDPNVRYAGIAGSLLRSESVASSRIERLNVDAETLGLAAINEARPKSDAAQVWANVTAMIVAVDQAVTAPVSPDTFNMIHHALMCNAPYEAEWAGRYRDMPSWIGGSDECPRDATHVPPAAHRIPDLLVDLSAWCERRDIEPVTRAAIAHAQFETIHPYTDGNGRTGRAIVHTVLRRTGTVSASIVPASSALLAEINTYFDSLNAYRHGDIDRYVQHFAESTARASTEARALGAELKAISTEMHASGAFRPGSAAATIATSLIQQPVISASRNGAVEQGKVEPSTIYRAIDTLVKADILIEVTDNKRNQVWSAPQVTAALDDFTRRLGQRQTCWDG